ncbi:MAG: Methyltransferase type 11 [candidate division TM6 bacterium GW2011_GWF2_32_72]|nr:MAG: Methyltransferase type 11 [candidate division TM6 bacterium GW2011_GWF2_32_72]
MKIYSLASRLSRSFFSSFFLKPMVFWDRTHGFLKRNTEEETTRKIVAYSQKDRDKWVEQKTFTISAGAKVLDVGAGTCPYKNLFKHCEYRTHDFKKYEGPKLDAKEYGHIDYVSDICSIPVKDSSFDVILCTEVLEHVPMPIDALQEMARILKPGGRLFLTAPFTAGQHQLPFHYYSGFAPAWYKHFCAEFGLSIAELTPNKGYFKFMAMETNRVAHYIKADEKLQDKDFDLKYYLFGIWMPNYLEKLEKKKFIDTFTTGFFVEAIKK